MSIKDRKKDHVDLTTSGEVDYQIPAGFEQYYFAHNALPEINIDNVSTEVGLLDRTFSSPLFISSMTGGYTDAGAVNAIIAEFCEEYNLPFGVGSQRVMLEDPETTTSFSIVREKAPNAFIASNIGGAQLVGGLSKKKLDLLINSIEANAVIVHLNPLQELMQPEGDRNFRGIEKGITQLCQDTTLPIIVKETGAGISAEVGRRLLDAGVKVIDVAGAGGTSWAKVENERASNKNPDNNFNDWGIPTLECVTQLVDLKEEYDFELIASGGIRSSHDIAKSLCLGADFAASAQPVIKAVADDGYEGLEQLYQKWNKQLVTIQTLLGCKTPSELTPKHIKLKR
ncbi:type 2 isopentenyl-diphosphate Delta-isomerase [Aliifodinibius salipaludis]|uniref:Isopentenyl-diphosphate delta-isomerase n=1 Tax=Fodinibius salipaludis TaxID=2032627 RepID=A0A2A2G918_9BACT|nr:type 2 isopentenyl-diphosphate Delta-isomerase [Aliifodinibius salipaludis]PAU93798.1 type 2 isopentenyl-diphosphate Delta-isomerase [Aliifodinibius salipaludis]